MALLPAGDAGATLQDKLIIKGLCNLLRAEKKLAKVQSCVAEIMKIELLGVQPPGITAELADFCKLLWPLRADTSVTEVQQAVARFHTDKSLRLWRPLFLFPTGKDIMDAAAKGIEQRALDDRMLLQLTELTAKVAGFVDLAKRNVVNATTGMVDIPDISERREAREQPDAIRGRRSRECQLTNNVSLAEKELLAGATEIERQAKFYYEQHLDAIMEGVVEMVDSYPKAGSGPARDVVIQGFRGKLSSAIVVLPTGGQASGGILAPGVVVESWQSQHATSSCCWLKWPRHA